MGIGTEEKQANTELLLLLPLSGKEAKGRIVPTKVEVRNRKGVEKECSWSQFFAQLKGKYESFMKVQQIRQLWVHTC